MIEAVFPGNLPIEDSPTGENDTETCFSHCKCSIDLDDQMGCWIHCWSRI